jgi:hypothetical protein
MLGIVFIYFIWKYFSQLATTYSKPNHIGWGILGVIVYYAGTFIAGILLGILYYSFNEIGEMDNLVISLIAIPFGLAACWLLKRQLLKSWSANSTDSSDLDVLDQDI